MVTALAVVAASSAGACGDVVTREDFEQAHGVAAPVQPRPERAPEAIGGGGGFPFGTPSAPPPGGPGGATERPPAGAPIGFGDGRRVVDAAMAVMPGERSLVEVVLYEGYGTVTSRSASGDVDSAIVRSDRAEPPTPLPDAFVQDPEQQRFSVDDVVWEVIPDLVQRTPGDLGIDGGVVSHVIVEQNVPFSPDLVIRVYVSTVRKSGRIDYLADGRVFRAYPA